jgi:adenylosuccinate lyase
MNKTISPLDNRYLDKIQPLLNYFSESSWIKYRINVELLYFKFLYNLIPKLQLKLNQNNLMKFLDIKSYSTDTIITDIMELEKITHHDIKSIEMALRYYYDIFKVGEPQYKEYIHFGLTSQDINSVAFSLQLRDCMKLCIQPKIQCLFTQLKDKSVSWKNITMMARTHGQGAIPTTLGKEMNVFIERLQYCFVRLEEFEYYTKIGGAVGSLAAHYLSYPKIDWVNELSHFCRNLGLKRWETTTQITNYEDIIELSQTLIRFNSILIDLCQDIWLYTNNNIFILKKENENQVGSSTMPQKINPIHFENAEGNLKLANMGLQFFCEKLSISRLQRDLTDSTVLRNYGVYIGHLLVALSSIENGLNKLQPNVEYIKEELESHPEILGEAIQCLLRKHGIENSYEIVREILQGTHFLNIEDLKMKVLKKIKKNDIISQQLENDIMKLEFDNYLGCFGSAFSKCC